MKNVVPINVSKNVDELLKSFEDCGALGAGSVGRANSLVKKMFDQDYFVFLSFSGHLIAAGLRNIISDLIKQGKVDAIVTSGAGLVHDIIYALGGAHYQGSFNENDEELKNKGLGRAGNVLVPTKSFESFEEFCQKNFEKIEGPLSIQEFTHELGGFLSDENSFLYQAFKKKVPVYCPGFQDSMLGLQLALYNQTKSLVVDATKDMMHMNSLLEQAEKVGAIILGGGIPKHYTLGANILRGGLDAAVNVTTSTPFDGSLSGARLEEAKSWGKASAKSSLVTIYADATIIFPLMMSGAL